MIRNVGGGSIKTIDSGHIQSSGEYETNALVIDLIEFTLQHPHHYTAPNLTKLQYLRPHLYSEYDIMDTDAIIASALDIS